MRRTVGTIASVALVAATTSCSVYEDLTTSAFAKQDAEAIVEAASAAMRDVDSLRMTGQVRERGTQYFIDLRLNRAGDCAGSIRLRHSTLDIRRVGERTWVSGDDAFIRLVAGNVSQAVVERIGGKWVAARDRDVADLCDLDSLLDVFEVVDYGTEDSDDASGDKGRKDRKGEDERSAVSDGDVEVTVSEETDLDGLTAVKISGRPGGSHDETVWVASDAPHHVVKVESTAMSDGGQLTLAEFDQEVEVSPPDPEDLFRA